jgi:hypothetical protein
MQKRKNEPVSYQTNSFFTRGLFIPRKYSAKKPSRSNKLTGGLYASNQDKLSGMLVQPIPIYIYHYALHALNPSPYAQPSTARCQLMKLKAKKRLSLSFLA